MQKDLLLQDVNQQLSGKEFDNCSFYRLDEPRTYLCIHKADCWEKSFIVFQKDDEIRVMKGETYEWLDSVTTNRGGDGKMVWCGIWAVDKWYGNPFCECKRKAKKCSIEVLGRNKQQMMFTKFSFWVYRIIN